MTKPRAATIALSRLQKPIARHSSHRPIQAAILAYFLAAINKRVAQTLAKLPRGTHLYKLFEQIGQSINTAIRHEVARLEDIDE